MKTLNSYIVIILVFLLNSGQAISQLSGSKKYSGKYEAKNSNETIYLFNDSTFYLLTTGPNRKIFDVVIPFCDTLALGRWDLSHANVIKLSNNSNFDKTPYSIIQESKYSQDLVYIKINIPKDDAFKPDRFNAFLNFMLGTNVSKSNDSVIVIPRNKNLIKENNSLSLTIQDLYPNCGNDSKCYQRIYFNIFEDIKINTRAYNYFTITLDQFNQCYVERMDISNELLYFNKGSIF